MLGRANALCAHMQRRNGCLYKCDRLLLFVDLSFFIFFTVVYLEGAQLTIAPANLKVCSKQKSNTDQGNDGQSRKETPTVNQR